MRELLREFFGGKEPHMSIAPDEVAAHGAAVQAEAQVRKPSPCWPRSRASFNLFVAVFPQECIGRLPYFKPT